MPPINLRFGWSPTLFAFRRQINYVIVTSFSHSLFAKLSISFTNFHLSCSTLNPFLFRFPFSVRPIHAMLRHPVPTLNDVISGWKEKEIFLIIIFFAWWFLNGSFRSIKKNCSIKDFPSPAFSLALLALLSRCFQLSSSFLRDGNLLRNHEVITHFYFSTSGTIQRKINY